MWDNDEEFGIGWGVGDGGKAMGRKGQKVKGVPSCWPNPNAQKAKMQKWVARYPCKSHFKWNKNQRYHKNILLD